MITIPEEYFVAVREGSEQLGFAAPETNNAASEKRKVTIRNWAGKEAREFTFKNELIGGFEISEHVRRSSSWNSKGNVVWRITDPRGFDLEISSSNFAKIVEETDIMRGRIEQRCVWGRDSYGSNVLIVEDSTPHTVALNATKLRNAKSVSATSIPVGAVVTMRTGEDQVYLGSYFGLINDVKLKRVGNGGYVHKDINYNNIKASLSNWRRRCVFIRKEIYDANIQNLKNISPTGYTVFSDTTNVSFNTGDSVSISEGEAYDLVQCLVAGKYTRATSRYNADAAFLERSAIKTISYNLKPLEMLDFEPTGDSKDEERANTNFPWFAAIFAREKGNGLAPLHLIVGYDSRSGWNSFSNRIEHLKATALILAPCNPSGLSYKFEAGPGQTVATTMKELVEKYDTFYMEVEIPGKSKILAMRENWQSTPTLNCLKEAIKALQ